MFKLLNETTPQAEELRVAKGEVCGQTSSQNPFDPWHSLVLSMKCGGKANPSDLEIEA
jgi:hypothetical protein